MSGIYDSVRVWKDLLTQGLEDDDWRWDWTTLGTIPADKKLRARVIAKSKGVWAASGLVEAVNQHDEAFRSGASSLVVRSTIHDGDRIEPGQVVAEWQGNGRILLAMERPFLNLASYVSGIATRTRGLVDLVKKACPQNTPRVTSTRKTLPGYRDLAIHGVIAGGGSSHRMSLSGGVLIKENHIAGAGGVSLAIAGARAIAPHGLKIEIEVTSLQELQQALDAGADVVMLDNFSPPQVLSALDVVKRAARRPLIEVSGGLHEATIADYAIEGVDILSVGSLTHSVQAVDLSLLVQSE